MTMFFLTPRYLKNGRQFVKDARKLIAYKRDLASEEAIAEVQREITHLETALSARDQEKVQAQMKQLDEACGKLTKPVSDPLWRENVEVFLVAIVIALAVRTYFLQPFTIPTGSMQPTLNGIIFHETPNEPAPNPILRLFGAIVSGRTYVDVVAQADEDLTGTEIVHRIPVLKLLEAVRLTTSAGNSYTIPASSEVAQKILMKIPQKNFMQSGPQFKKGDVIVRGYYDTGDHVFVDKFTYNFRFPQRGDVFVFSTLNIKMRNAPEHSQYYIKRLAGLPGDTLRIDPPRLFVNGKPASEPGIARVMEGTDTQPKDDYRGYCNSDPFQALFLRSPGETMTVPPHSFFALGDNSYNSSDSRYWGRVPEQNVMGRAIFVYWPFTYWPKPSHWGFIH